MDENRGEKFPPALLLSYRDEHEARIQAEHENLPFNRLHELLMGRNPVFEVGSRAVFSKLTLVIGGNATGKSTLYRWIDQLSASSRSYETQHKGPHDLTEYSARISAPNTKTVYVFRDDADLRFLLNGEPVLFNPVGLEVINYERIRSLPMLETFLAGKRRDFGDHWEADVDDVDAVAEYMGLNPLLIPTLLPLVGKYVPSGFRRVRIVREGQLRRIVGDDINWREGVSIHSASGSQLSRTVLEMEIAMANLTAQVRPTFLLLKNSVLHFDADNLRRYFDFFLSPGARFQTIFSTVDEREIPGARELGATILRLSGRAPNCRIEVQTGGEV